MSDGFFLNRPDKRPEFWTTEEWSAAVMGSDWHRRKERVARDYGYAVRQVHQQEFEAAHQQLKGERKATLQYDERGFVVPTDEQVLAVSRGLERMADRAKERAEMAAAIRQHYLTPPPPLPVYTMIPIAAGMH